MTNRKKGEGKSPPSQLEIDALSTALQQFSESPRAALLENLLITALAPKGKRISKQLSSLTIRDLLTAEIKSFLEKTKITAADVKVLISIITSLIDENTASNEARSNQSLNSDPTLGIIPPSNQRTSRLPGTIGLSSVESELRLANLLSRLRSAPGLKELSFQRIGEYWEEGWVRAPFEEALTFGQLADLKPRALLEKRSFTAQKLLHLINAVERGIDTTAHKSRTPNPDQAQHHSHGLKAFDISSWLNEGSEYPATVSASLTMFAHEVSNMGSDNGSIKDLLMELPPRLSAREYLAAVLLEELDLGTASTLLKIDPNTIHELAASCYRKIAELLKASSSQVALSCTSLLLQPAVPVSKIEQSLFNDSFSPVFRSTLSCIFARALGASPVTIKGTLYRKYWASTPQAAERVLQLLISGLPKSDSELRVEASALFPLISFEQIAEWISGWASLNEREKRWQKAISPSLDR